MKKIIAVMCVFIIILVLAAVSPVMNIETAYVVGNERFSRAEILRDAGFSEGINIFAFNTRQAIENLYDNTYIKQVDIAKNYFARTLTIEIVERQLSGYVRFRDNTYLFIDADGMVLESRTSFTERHPVIEGLHFSEFTVGEYLVVENNDAFETMIQLSYLFKRYDIHQDIIRINLSRENDIHFYYGNINIQMGSRQDLDLKIRKMMAILPELEAYKNIGGFLHMQDPLMPRFSLLS